MVVEMGRALELGEAWREAPVHVLCIYIYTHTHSRSKWWSLAVLSVDARPASTHQKLTGSAGRDGDCGAEQSLSKPSWDNRNPSTRVLFPSSTQFGFCQEGAL